jgi:hypothetical protein
MNQLQQILPPAAVLGRTNLAVSDINQHDLLQDEIARRD